MLVLHGEEGGREGMKWISVSRILGTSPLTRRNTSAKYEMI
jgi:hypothetical protein